MDLRLFFALLRRSGTFFSGIPQGTVLGPLLLVVYINDILESITSDGFLFVDDTKLFRKITSKEDALNLQSDIYMGGHMGNEFQPRQVSCLNFRKIW